MINNDILTKLHRAFSSAGVLERETICHQALAFVPRVIALTLTRCIWLAVKQRTSISRRTDDLDVASRAHMYAPPSIL